MQEGPFKSAIEAATDNIIKQELITYYVNDDGNTAKKVAVRKFAKEDYTDHTSTEILTSIKLN